MTAPLAAYGFDGAVCCAGGHITLGGAVLYDRPLTKDEQAALLDALRESGAFVILEAKDAAYAGGSFAEFLAQAGPGSSELERWRAALEDNLGVLSMSDYRGEPVYKATFACFDIHQMDRAKERLSDRFAYRVHNLFSGMVNGEFILRAFDKGRAIRRVCDALGADIADTIAFGDSGNDFEMIAAAGVGVCMGNGSPELKKQADMVCGNVDADGLAHAFARLKLV